MVKIIMSHESISMCLNYLSELCGVVTRVKGQMVATESSDDIVPRELGFDVVSLLRSSDCVLHSSHRWRERLETYLALSQWVNFCVELMKIEVAEKDPECF